MKKLIVLFILLSSCQSDNLKREYYNNGNLKKEYEVNKLGEKHGVYNEYYENGQLQEKSVYINGFLNGQSFLYYSNGQIHKIANSKMDLFEGSQKAFSKNGILQALQLYKHDTLLIHKQFHENGKPEIFTSKMAFKGEDDYNSYVEFDKSGKIKNSSYYLEWNIENDTLSIHFAKGFEKFAIKMKFVDDFNSMKVKREMVFSRGDKFKIQLQPEDYINNRLNIIFQDFHPETDEYESYTIEYYLQIDKGEKPKKYNLDYIEL